MLYLFGRLALSDSLTYHEYFTDEDYPAGAGSGPAPTKPEVSTRLAVVSRRLRRHRHRHFPASRRA